MMFRKKFIIYLFIIIGTCGVYFFSYKNQMVDVSVFGPLNAGDGIGAQSSKLIENLSPLGLNINFIVRSKVRFWHVRSFALLKSVFNPNRNLGKIVIYEYPLTLMPELIFFKKQFLKRQSDTKPEILIAYSMFETSKLYEEAVNNLNKYFDAVIVPDKNLVNIYIESGVTIPIFVIPLDIDYGNLLEYSIKDRRNKKFVFMNLGTLTPRKNQLKLLEAFDLAYGNNPNFELIINSRNRDQSTYYQFQKYIKDHNLRNVTYGRGRISRNNYEKLLASADCYVSASLGEGFSIQPREAMALGIPTIVTDDNIGQKTIADSGLVEVIKSNIKVEAASYFSWSNDKYLDLGYMYDAEISDIKQSMENIVNNYDYYLSIAPKAREWATKYQFGKFMDEYQNIVKPKKIIFGNKNEITKQYLMTNNKKLYKKYIRLLER